MMIKSVYTVQKINQVAQGNVVDKMDENANDRL